MIARNDIPPPGSRPTATLPSFPQLTADAPGGGSSHDQRNAAAGAVLGVESPGSRSEASACRAGHFIHGERCDCGECRCRYRQGDSIASHDASAVSVGWTLVLLAASALLIWGWIELLT